jgi:two-component system chemotaxis response regulator CheB
VPASFAVDGEPIKLGHIYVAPKDRHLLVSDGRLEVTRGPQENGFRPAVDPLFRTAAESHGPRVVGIVLSGGLNDGTYGLKVIKRHGGIAIAQRVEDALVSSMPLSAIQNVEIDYILSVREMPAVLVKLAGNGNAPELVESRGDMKRQQPDVAKRGKRILHGEKPRGVLAPFVCPACNGPLWESREGTLVRFACHVGHGFTAESLMKGQDDGIEMALWSAVRALEEKAALRRRMATHAHRGNLGGLASGYDNHAEEAERQADLIRDLLTDGKRAQPIEAEPPARKRAARRRAAPRT